MSQPSTPEPHWSGELDTTLDEALPTSAVSPRVHQLTGTADDAAPPQRTRLDRYHDRPELHIESDHVARIVSGAVAAFILLGLVPWIVEALDQWDVIEPVRPWWFRLPQLLLAAVGVAAAVVEAVYLADHFLLDFVFVD
jgi:type IV secretory pathway TrbD component